MQEIEWADDRARMTHHGSVAAGRSHVFALGAAWCNGAVMDNIVLASTYRITAVNFRLSAEIVFEKFKSQGEPLPRNIRGIPFYYLISHDVELLLKCALLKRGLSPTDLKKYPLRHSLEGLLQEVINLGVPISEHAVSLIKLLSNQHEKHELRYTALLDLLDGGDQTFTPEPSDLFLLLDELLMAGRIATYGV